jgi:hypothetical protein
LSDAWCMYFECIGGSKGAVSSAAEGPGSTASDESGVGKKYGAAYGCVRAGGFAGVCACACRWILSLSEWHRPATGGQVTQERRACGTAYEGGEARAWQGTGERWTGAARTDT